MWKLVAGKPAVEHLRYYDASSVASIDQQYFESSSSIESGVNSINREFDVGSSVDSSLLMRPIDTTFGSSARP